MRAAMITIWVAGAALYAIDLVQRANGYGFMLHTTDAIALLLLAGAGAIVFRPQPSA